MTKFSQYKIVLRNFSNEPQKYEFQLDNQVFKQLDETTDIQNGSVKVVLTVKKTSAAFEFIFDIHGTVFVPCDRCLDEMPIEIDTQNKLFVKLGNEYSEESEDIVIIPEDESEINIIWFIYEFIVLNIPIKRVHPPGKCNRGMMSKLNNYLSYSTAEEHEDGSDEVQDNFEDDNSNENIDPRWAALKGLDKEK